MTKYGSCFLKFDLRFLWIIPISMLIHHIVVGTYQAQVAISAIFAAIATMLVFSAADYSTFSFTSLYPIMSFVSFPIAAYVNLLIDYPAVRQDLWLETPYAMWGYAVGLLYVFIGVKAHNLVESKKITVLSNLNIITSSTFNCLLVLLIIFIAGYKYYLGLYFHSSITDYNFGNEGYLNLLEHLSWISYCGIFLQVYRYIQTKSRRDLFCAIGISLLPLIIYIPSGSREQAFGYIPLLLLFYFNFEKNARLQLISIIVGIVVLVPLVIIVGVYRDMKGLSEASAAEKYIALQVAANEAHSESIDPKSILIGRISDYVAAGRLIAQTPSEFPYSGFEGVSEWYQIFLPGFLRPSDSKLDLNDGATKALRYGVSNNTDSSNPIMTVGDLFSRFGWSGIIVGMFIIGYLLAHIDSLLRSQNILFFIIFSVLFARVIWRLYTVSLLSLVVYFTREILIVYVIASILTKIATKYTERVCLDQV